MDKTVRLIRLAILKQWFHSIYALVNTNRPDGMFGSEDPNYLAANQLQDIAWKRYCAIGNDIRAIQKDENIFPKTGF